MQRDLKLKTAAILLNEGGDDYLIEFLGRIPEEYVDSIIKDNEPEEEYDDWDDDDEWSDDDEEIEEED